MTDACKQRRTAAFATAREAKAPDINHVAPFDLLHLLGLRSRSRRHGSTSADRTEQWRARFFECSEGSNAIETIRTSVAQPQRNPPGRTLRSANDHFGYAKLDYHHSASGMTGGLVPPSPKRVLQRNIAGAKESYWVDALGEIHDPNDREGSDQPNYPTDLR
jgi:hypothetical protein